MLIVLTYRIELQDVDLVEVFKEIRARREKYETERAPYGLNFSRNLCYMIRILRGI
jgi:hypothetical protein